jgi:hypothetical protein
MKRTIYTLLSSAIIFGANAADGVHLKINKDDFIGGIVGSQAVFLYKNNDAAAITDPDKLKLMANILKKEICNDKDMRSVIESGISAIFIYPTKNMDAATIVTVENCD